MKNWPKPVFSCRHSALWGHSHSIVDKNIIYITYQLIKNKLVTDIMISTIHRAKDPSALPIVEQEQISHDYNRTLEA